MAFSAGRSQGLFLNLASASDCYVVGIAILKCHDLLQPCFSLCPGPTVESRLSAAEALCSLQLGDVHQQTEEGPRSVLAPPPLQENVLPEAPVTGPPEHIEKIDPYPPVPSFLAGSCAWEHFVRTVQME